MDAAQPFRILVVCTGNVCRSPLAERWLQHRLDTLAPGRTRVASAGTRALVGEPVAGPIAAIGLAEGVTFDGFAARQLEPKTIRAADLVLTAGREHLAEVLRAEPAALKRTFLIRELARILGDASFGAERRGAAEWRPGWKQAIARASAFRRAPSRDDEVTDPFRRGPAAYEAMASQLLPALDALQGYGERLV
ncbi:low molecular weight phosphatase family protein [Sinomonas flava]|uniref:Low molecular weight phosphatase family protein n=1 Tax=Sinomonas flava TaxID=496857 RepID=A0ABP5NMG2_9MICC